MTQLPNKKNAKKKSRGKKLAKVRKNKLPPFNNYFGVKKKKKLRVSSNAYNRHDLSAILQLTILIN